MGATTGQDLGRMTGRAIVGRYELRELVGKGAAARVYRALDTHLGRDIAIKMLTEDAAADPAFVERFHREARAIASLNHPNVVKVFDWGSDDGIDYMVMEHVQGGSLAHLLRTGGPLAEDEALHIAAGIARALAAAHNRGIVHRDIKPDNILLTEHREPKVADFGIARAQGVSNLTLTNVICGTVSYISPEQARGDDLDGRSDLYSLGVVLYQMLTGSLPFQGTSMVDVAIQHVQKPAPSPHALRPGLSPETVSVISRALAKSPADRFPDARAMLHALEDSAAQAQGLAVERVSAQVAPTLAAPLPHRVGRVPVRPPRSQPQPSGRFWPLIVIPVILLFLAAGAVAAHPWSGSGRSIAGSSTAATPTPPAARKSTAVTSHRRGSSAGPSQAPSSSSSPPAQRGQAPANPAPTAGHATASTSPTDTVIRFYTDVGTHAFTSAARLWSPSLLRADPPAEYIDQRFADTRSVWVNGLSVIAQDPTHGTATVAARVTETKMNGNTAEFSGTWQLVEQRGRWLLNWPNLQPVQSSQVPVEPKLPHGHEKAHDHGHHGKGKD